MGPTSTTICVLTGNEVGNLNVRFKSNFTPSNVTLFPPWSLTHTLYRANPDPANPKPISSNQHLHVLQISNIDSRTLLCTTSDSNPSNVIAIPQGAATAEFTRLLKDKLGVLWQAMRQGDLHVSNGTCFEVGMFRVRIGELLRDRGIASGGIENRGTIVAISLLGDDEAVDTGLQEKEILREFCEGLGIRGNQPDPKLVSQSWGDFRTWKTEVELWCDVMEKLVLGGGARVRAGEQTM